MNIGFIGAGNMAFALACAISNQSPRDRIHIFDISSDRIVLFKESIPDTVVCSSNSELSKLCDVVFLAVKPQILPSIYKELSSCSALTISIAAGIRIAELEKNMPSARIIRVMPNTPCLAGAMAAGYSAGSSANAEDLQTVEHLLATAGIAVEIPEGQMDALTAISGSGPAFVARFIEAFTEAGIAEGLSKETSAILSMKTFEGTAKLLMEKGLTPEELVTMVSSPNGTTVAGREKLESSNYKEIIADTVRAAKQRSIELGKE